MENPDVEMYYTDSSDESNAPPDVWDMSSQVTMNLLPKNSRLKYEKAYEAFKSWCDSKEVCKITENILMAYITEKSKVVKPSTLWSTYSMLKTTIRVKENVDIGQFDKLVAFLKQQNIGFQTKKSKILSNEDVKTFLLEATDDCHLLRKVILIFGVFGGCRRDQLTKLTVNDVEDKESFLMVKIPDTETCKSRMFTIVNDNEQDIDYLGIYRKYRNLRPTNVTTDRLFIKYQKGVCTNQNVGINTIGKIPKEIAKFLKLPEPALYTGHCFRRTSATLLANVMTQLKNHGSWMSASLAEDYIEDDIRNKIDTSKILGQSTVVIQSKDNEEHNIETTSTSGLIIQNNTNCTFNITVINKPEQS